MAVRHAQTIEALPVVQQDLRSFDAVLVKGSRFMRMERMAQSLRTFGQQSQPKSLKEDAHAA